jgi:hypothetical protein
MCANGSPGSISPAKVRKVGRTVSVSRLSVITMSRIGCATEATLSQTPSAWNMRRAAAAIAEARVSPPWLLPSMGSAITARKRSPSDCRRAIASASPANPPPPISTSVREDLSVNAHLCAASTEKGKDG